MAMTIDSIHRIATHADAVVDHGTALLAIDVPARRGRRLDRAAAAIRTEGVQIAAHWSEARAIFKDAGFHRVNHIDHAARLVDINPVAAWSRSAVREAVGSARLLQRAIGELPTARAGIERMGPIAWTQSALEYYPERTALADVVEFMSAEGRLEGIDDATSRALGMARAQRNWDDLEPMLVT